MKYPHRQEIDTRIATAPNSFQAGIIQLDNLSEMPMVLRHQKYSAPKDTINLFCKDTNPDHPDAQVFINTFELPEGAADFQRELEFYEKKKKGFRLDGARGFESTDLQLSGVPEIYRHDAFQVRDGAHRRRLVHAYTSQKHAVLVVFSLDNQKFLANTFFNAVIRNLKIRKSE
jgi:hypothetical protein